MASSWSVLIVGIAPTDLAMQYAICKNVAYLHTVGMFHLRPWERLCFQGFVFAGFVLKDSQAARTNKPLKDLIDEWWVR
jgi:hypothetical protein